MAEYRKKLIEVALPLKAINEASAREKSIRHGHPSTLHLWWARRPLAACRAVLFASLVDDPDSDPAFAGDPERAGIKRATLFNLIEELVQWENSNNEEVIRSARAEIARSVASNLVEQGTLAKDHKLAGGTTVGELVRDGHCMPVPAVESNGRAKKGKSLDSAKRFRFATAHLPPAEAVNDFLANHAPPVLDPFCGGGSIPLEAQRLGLRAYASDLNPVPVLITKALIEIPPKFAGMPPVNPETGASLENSPGRKAGVQSANGQPGGKAVKLSKKTQQHLVKTEREWNGAQGLAADVRYYGKWMRDEAEKRIGHLYPKVKIAKEMAKDRSDLKVYVGEELTVIAWLWSRTVASPNPAARGEHTPLVRSFWLSTKKGKETYVKPVVDRKTSTFEFVVKSGNSDDDFDPGEGTIGRKGGRCILTGAPMPFTHVRTEGQAGRMQQRLMAIVAEGERGRVYLSPDPAHAAIAGEATPTWRPDGQLPDNPRDFKTPNYGMRTFADLFTPRQLVALSTLSDLVQEARERVLADAQKAWPDSNPESKIQNPKSADLPFADGGTGPTAYADAVATYLAFSIDRALDRSSTICTWDCSPKMEALRSTFARQALPMTWDFAEGNPFSASSGNWHNNLDWVCMALEATPIGPPGNVRQLDATAAVNGLEPPLISTDPPYYDNIGYADLSDFFYVWMRRSLSNVYSQLFATLLTPKAQELIASPYRHGGSKEKAQAFFEQGLGTAFTRIREAQKADLPFTVYYAFKQAESDDSDAGADDNSSAPMASTGWETMLAGLIASGCSIHGTWPVRTEMSNRNIGMGANALASSIVLVCHRRSTNATLATRKQFLAAMKAELPEALRSLQHGNIAPVDLAQAAIGPGMAVFTRYAKVVESDGSPMTVRTALGLINQTLDEVLAEQEGEFDADTRWALAWFQEYGTADGPFGIAETLSKAKNTAVNGLVEAGVITARAGKVRLVNRDELPDDWDPARDNRLAIWEVTQHLIRTLEQDGEAAAAELVHKLGGTAEIARDLAYRLYNICERNRWAEEALSYNGLVLAWPELTKLALAERARRGETTQQGLSF